MYRIAKFEKVSPEQFCRDWTDTFRLDDGITVYEGINMPRRATAGSAGYDIYAPLDFELKCGESIKIPTGLRAKIDEGWVLMIYPRSGLGFKYRLQLNNTVGVIDSDYYGAANEGHIFIKLTNDGTEGKELCVKRGEAFAQGVFMPFGITVDDDSDGVRTGGFGSTDSANRR
ncbi:MAG: dUTP diphosphatase [Clostridiales bacterium]|nr:dUTP diphosphatase [Clostridiales bacterium]